MIRRRGKEYVLVSKTTGKVLGRHKTKAGAMQQERAVQARKHAREDGGERSRYFEPLSLLALVGAGAFVLPSVLQTIWSTLTGSVRDELARLRGVDVLTPGERRALLEKVRADLASRAGDPAVDEARRALERAALAEPGAKMRYAELLPGDLVEVVDPATGERTTKGRYRVVGTGDPVLVRDVFGRELRIPANELRKVGVRPGRPDLGQFVEPGAALRYVSEARRALEKAALAEPGAKMRYADVPGQAELLHVIKRLQKSEQDQDDAWVLQEFLRLAQAGQLDDAYAWGSRMDTLVRDYIPAALWRHVGGTVHGQRREPGGTPLRYAEPVKRRESGAALRYVSADLGATRVRTRWADGETFESSAEFWLDANADDPDAADRLMRLLATGQPQPAGGGAAPASWLELVGPVVQARESNAACPAKRLYDDGAALAVALRDAKAVPASRAVARLLRADRPREFREALGQVGAVASLADVAPLALRRRLAAFRDQALEVAELMRYQVSNIPEPLLRGLCAKWSPDEGFRTRCIESASDGGAPGLDGFDVSSPGAFCNALKIECAKRGML